MDSPQKLKVEDVKRKLSCETSQKNRKLKMWKRSFRLRRPSKTESWRCENDAWSGSYSARPVRASSKRIRDSLAPAARQNFPIHLRRHVLCCKTQHLVHPLSLKNTFRARLPSKTESWRCENEAFMGDVPPKLKVEVVNARFFERDVFQKRTAEVVKTKLLCETSLRNW